MLAASGRCASVLLAKVNECAAVDLSTPASPRLIGRSKLPHSDVPYVSYSGAGDWILMPVAGESEALALDLPGSHAGSGASGDDGRTRQADFLVCARQRESVVEVFQCTPHHSLGRLPLKGPFNLSRTRPTGLSYAPERGLLAVATRSGTIHLIELVWRIGSRSSHASEVAARGSERSIR